MMNTNGPRPRSLIEDMENTAVTSMFLVGIWATSLEVFLHKGMGRRYLGWHAFGVLILIPFYVVFWQGHDPRPIFLFLLAYLFMLGVVRAGMFDAGMLDRHSYYNGFPRLMRANSKVDEVDFKRSNEPAFVFVLGAIVCVFNQPLGVYLVIGAFCLAFQGKVAQQLQEMQTMDVNDAIIDQKLMMQHFRSKSRR